MMALDRFKDKFVDKPYIREWLMEHDNEYQRMLEKRFTNVSDIAHNFVHFLKVEPELGYYLTMDEIITNNIKSTKVLDWINTNSFVANIVGRKGGGKSAFLGFIAEQLHSIKTKVYMFETNYNLPDWFNVTLTFDEIEDDSFVGIDEGSMTFSARKAMTKENKNMSDILAISRHRGLKVMINQQAMGGTDINFWRLGDAWFIKPLQLFDTMEHERSREKQFMRYLVYMQPRTFHEVLFTNGDDWFKYRHPLPSFWSDTVSKQYKRFEWTDVIDFILKSYDSRVPERLIQQKLQARGWTMETGEIRMIFNHPEKARASADFYKKYEKKMKEE